jgi:anti-sigma B factor antagonist
MLTVTRNPSASGAMVLELTGTLTLGNSCQELEWEVDNLLKEGCKKIVFDLTKLTRVDSAGIGIIVRTSGKVRVGGGDFRAAGATGQVQEIVTLTRIDSIVDFYTDVQKAVEAAAGAGA